MSLVNKFIKNNSLNDASIDIKNSDKKFLEENLLDEMGDKLDPNDDRRGVYNNMFFFMRLRPDVHNLVQQIIEMKDDDSFTILEKHLAMSTFYHENWHWWQYIGSTSGLISSLAFPAQITTNLIDLKKHISLSGKVKPIIRYAKKLPPTEKASLKEKNEINKIKAILIQAEAIRYYRMFVKEPVKLAGKVQHREAEYFKSVGYSFYTAYISSIMLLRSVFGDSHSFLPSPYPWVEKFNELQKKNKQNYHDFSELVIYPIDTRSLYEGQARFNQLLYLNIASNKKLDWSEFDHYKMLEGVYYEAFTHFMNILHIEKRPESINDPLIALYLLIIDIAINPTEGFPFDIINPHAFVELTNPGTRFIYLCHIVNDSHPELKNAITSYSGEEYKNVTRIICDSAKFHLPEHYENKVRGWCENESCIIDLLKQNESFKYESSNILIRIVFARFLSFQLDKFEKPEFFCWPGAYMNDVYKNKELEKLHFKHFAIFREDKNRNIAPATSKSVSNENILNTTFQFYQALGVYDLCRQWIYEDGPFKYRFAWTRDSEVEDDIKNELNSSYQAYFGESLDGFREF
ncbi:MAG: hypothetical protein KIB40_12780 [Pantoea sp.]|uniref:Uncharacterized protein n=1 Tax=Pantoea brenneri TaxID=472694 RepID=A0AAX3JBV1_9GAMM|nr:MULTISPECIES: hypothetical protein [Pantoea]MBS6034000.1 hypothetical protein [Pantoea sp.]VXC58666.1 conserved hypothetical protein [Pantoea brenneri]